MKSAGIIRIWMLVFLIWGFYFVSLSILVSDVWYFLFYACFFVLWFFVFFWTFLNLDDSFQCSKILILFSWTFWTSMIFPKIQDFFMNSWIFRIFRIFLVNFMNFINVHSFLWIFGLFFENFMNFLVYLMNFINFMIFWLVFWWILWFF